MTESTTPPPPEGPTADETFTWGQPPGHGAGSAPGSAGATLLESVRDAVDELAVRAGPSVREFSARAAELAAIAADKAAPFAKRAGEVTADASGKLATRSREWAAELRAPMTAADRSTGHDPTPPAPTSGVEPAEGAAGPTQEATDRT